MKQRLAGVLTSRGRTLTTKGRFALSAGVLSGLAYALLVLALSCTAIVVIGRSGSAFAAATRCR